jgi:hypothetical protein
MLAEGLASSYVAVGVTGLVHGLEPGHGWPLAVFLSRQRGRSAGFAGASAFILGMGHLVSSFAVVGIYFIAASFVDFSSDIFRYLAAAVLLVIAVRMWRESPGQETAPQKAVTGLLGLAWLALVLGFAHEEEFMLLGLAVGGLDPVVLMAVYAIAVVLSMIGVTLAAYYGFRFFERRLSRLEPYLPKITAAVLGVLAVLFLVGAY